MKGGGRRTRKFNNFNGQTNANIEVKLIVTNDKMIK